MTDTRWRIAGLITPFGFVALICLTNVLIVRGCAPGPLEPLETGPRKPPVRYAPEPRKGEHYA